ncbi:serine carboxypeptidase domain-containing protein [Ditylenchus destructor]|uniref:Serine carboxypeptidase domain-containing protein n=1 Tax=Ditylenchus destructor TaxID=166010 RepID=A0AAD4QXG6_9BILA|nr:serine carboxypeptidase domain-containing protein [Ditylenchus destructor]
MVLFYINFFVFLTVTIFLLSEAYIQNGTDEILRLPGWESELSSKQFSGFLSATKINLLHYWFVESQSQPASDPLVFWFNGGPGCSSMLGFLKEMGPYRASNDGQALIENHDAWNKFSNVIYIESPVYVWYSYASDGETVHMNDDTTADENYAAMKSFFLKHPKFRNHSVYIIGESYSGIYVPTLYKRVSDGQKEFPINLKGLGIANGFVNADLNANTVYEFFYGHGLVDEGMWNKVKTECCNGCMSGCNFTSHPSQVCRDMASNLWPRNKFLNAYDIIRLCDRNVRKDVRSALNIPESLGTWEICSRSVKLTYKNQYDDVSQFIKEALGEGVRVLMFYGDTDAACNFIHGQRFAESLGFPTKEAKQGWYYNNQTAGYKTVYEKGLTFITVAGVGHMSAEWKPAEVAYAIKQFLNDQPI